jgi:hypothetical protein
VYLTIELHTEILCRLQNGKVFRLILTAQTNDVTIGAMKSKKTPRVKHIVEVEVAGDLTDAAKKRVNNALKRALEQELKKGQTVDFGRLNVACHDRCIVSFKDEVERPRE